MRWLFAWFVEKSEAAFAELEKEQGESAKTEAAAVEATKAALATCERGRSTFSSTYASPSRSASQSMFPRSTPWLTGRPNSGANCKLESFENNRRNRFEPAIWFVLEAKQGAKRLLREIPSESAIPSKKSVRTSDWQKNRWPWISETLGNSWRISIPTQLFPSRVSAKTGKTEIGGAEVS
jgi:hypothetical protein